MGYNVFKRLFDIIAAALAVVFFLIFWLIIAIIIKIQSPGPVIYKAKRVGMNGNCFTLYKFRTMCTDSGAVHSTTLRNDPRVFSFGAFLRKTKLDETPQLINILQGKMSVIGPRPEDKENADKIFKGRFKKILSVKPGLSSPASLYDYTHGEKYESEELYEKEFLPKKLALELYYAEHKSIPYDIRIIARTVITILQIAFGKNDFEEPEEMKKNNLD